MSFIKYIFLSFIIAISTVPGLNFATSLNTTYTKVTELNARGELVTRDGPSTLFRADKRSPGEIKAINGFWAKGYQYGSVPGPDISLYRHVAGEENNFVSMGDDGYVSFTESKQVAEGWVASYLDKSAYVYEVHAYPNMIDVAATLKQYYQYPDEKEYAAIMGVEWEQVMGWNEYYPTTAQDSSNSMERKEYVFNDNYNRARFSGEQTGDAQYALAGFPINHPAWMENPWVFYSACRTLSYNRRDNATSTNTTCGPLESNQEYATQYVQALDACYNITL